MTRPRWPGRVLYLFLFLSVSGLSAALTVGLLVRGGGDVEVPAFVDRTVPEAESLAAARGLRLEILGSQFSEEVPEGVILHQDLAEGERVRAGRTVGVHLSRGPRERAAPRVVGLALDSARAVLKSADLAGEPAATACADGSEAQTILAQDPPPGGTVARRTLRLLVSTGPCANRFILPELRDARISEAVNELDRLGFVLRFFRNVERGDLPPFTIVETEPGAGSVVHPYDPITFVLSAAPKAVPADGGDRWLYVTVRSRPGLFRRPAVLRVDRGTPESRYSFDFLLTPGENAAFALWVRPGAEIALEVDGREQWRRDY
jgi:serine/threonine-protein kinase